MNKNFHHIGTAIFVIKDGEFLLGKRDSELGNGTWCLPGGHLEPGESIEDCGIRETFEETNLKIKSVKILGKLYTSSKGNSHETTFMKADYISGVEKPQDGEFSELKWCSIDNLPENLFHIFENFLDENKKLVEKMLKSS